MLTATPDSLRATDSLIGDIGLDTPSVDDIFRRLFWTNDPSDYTRENGAGEYKKVIMVALLGGSSFSLIQLVPHSTLADSVTISILILSPD